MRRRDLQPGDLYTYDRDPVHVMFVVSQRADGETYEIWCNDRDTQIQWEDGSIMPYPVIMLEQRVTDGF